jgi:hypothetical protein
MRLFLTMTAVVAGASILSACAYVDANRNYKQSVANYKDCLTANPTNVNACESQRLIMLTDERAVGRLDDIAGGRAHTLTVKER